MGSQSAFTAAAFIGATSLAGVFLSAPDAAAQGNGWCGIDCPNDVWCCGCWNGAAGGCVQGDYHCSAFDAGNPGISCWPQP